MSKIETEVAESDLPRETRKALPTRKITVAIIALIVIAAIFVYVARLKPPVTLQDKITVLAPEGSNVTATKLIISGDNGTNVTLLPNFVGSFPATLRNGQRYNATVFWQGNQWQSGQVRVTNAISLNVTGGIGALQGNSTSNTIQIATPYANVIVHGTVQTQRLVYGLIHATTPVTINFTMQNHGSYTYTVNITQNEVYNISLPNDVNYGVDVLYRAYLQNGTFNKTSACMPIGGGQFALDGGDNVSSQLQNWSCIPS